MGEIGEVEVAVGLSEPGLGLRELRESRGVTQVELGERLKMPQDQVSKLERRSDMKLSTLAKYLEALGARAAEIEVTFDAGERRSLPLSLG